VFVLVPILFTAFVLHIAIQKHALAVDFDNAYWLAGQRVLHGLSPYLAPHSAAVLSAGSSHAVVTPFVYPAVAALMYAAFALIPHHAADALATAMCMAAVLGTLRLMDVRNWRVYGLAFLWPPVVIGWQTANITLLLVLGAAAVWHYRDRPKVCAPLLALVISLKILLWPLALWLLAARRYRAFASTVIWALIVNAVAWAVVGYNEIPRYLNVLESLNRVGERRAYSVVSLGLHLGLSTAAATAVAYSLAVVIAGLCLKSGRAGRERVAFVLSVGLVLVVTPISWLHYFALLLIPLALVRGRLGVVWLLPLLMFGSPPTEPNTWHIALVLGISTVVVGLVVRAELATTRPSVLRLKFIA
jgi:hypothetical protein